MRHIDRLIHEWHFDECSRDLDAVDLFSGEEAPIGTNLKVIKKQWRVAVIDWKRAWALVQRSNKRLIEDLCEESQDYKDEKDEMVQQLMIALKSNTQLWFASDFHCVLLMFGFHRVFMFGFGSFHFGCCCFVHCEKHM